VSEYLLYMLAPTLVSATLLYIFGIARFSLQKKVSASWPFIFMLSIAMYFGSDPAVYFLRPWVFDCSKTIGICPGGLPIEDLLFSFLIVLNVTMGALSFSEMERRSRSAAEFLDYFFFFKDLRQKFGKRGKEGKAIK